MVDWINSEIHQVNLLRSTARRYEATEQYKKAFDAHEQIVKRLEKRLQAKQPHPRNVSSPTHATLIGALEFHKSQLEFLRLRVRLQAADEAVNLTREPQSKVDNETFGNERRKLLPVESVEMDSAFAENQKEISELLNDMDAVLSSWLISGATNDGNIACIAVPVEHVHHLLSINTRLRALTSTHSKLNASAPSQNNPTSRENVGENEQVRDAVSTMPPFVVVPSSAEDCMPSEQMPIPVGLDPTKLYSWPENTAATSVEFHERKVPEVLDAVGSSRKGSSLEFATTTVVVAETANSKSSDDIVLAATPLPDVEGLTASFRRRKGGGGGSDSKVRSSLIGSVSSGTPGGGATALSSSVYQNITVSSASPPERRAANILAQQPYNFSPPSSSAMSILAALPVLDERNNTFLSRKTSSTSARRPTSAEKTSSMKEADDHDVD